VATITTDALPVFAHKHVHADDGRGEAEVVIFGVGRPKWMATRVSGLPPVADGGMLQRSYPSVADPTESVCSVDGMTFSNRRSSLYSRASGPNRGTRRCRTRLFRMGPVSSQAACTRPPQLRDDRTGAARDLLSGPCRRSQAQW
jgi:hypothetical protein